MRKNLNKRVTALLLCILMAVGLTLMPGCSRQVTIDNASGLRYETVDQFLAAAVLRYPMTDEHLRYTLYDICAIVTECLTKDETVTIPATIEGVPVIAVASQAFYQNSTMKKLIIGSNVLLLDTGAFEECTALTTVQMSGSVNTINEGAFRNCVRLKSLIIPSSVDIIPANMMFGCENLKKVIIESRTASQKAAIKNKTVTRLIDNSAFGKCDSLVALWIPMDVGEITESILAGERRTAIYGEEKSAAARFAAAQRLDYGVTTRESFDASVRTYNPFEEDITASVADKTKVRADNFEITFKGVSYYKQVGNRIANNDMTLMVMSFSVKNTDVITQYFDGLNVVCKSWSRNQEGVIMPYLKRPHYFMNSLDIGGMLCGNVAAGQVMEGSVIIEVNTKMEYASVFFNNADDIFYIK